MNFTALLRSCASEGAVKRFHLLLIASSNLHSSTLFSTQSSSAENIFSWNSIITHYARQGLHLEVLKFFRRLVTQTFLRPDEYTFPLVLKSCDHPENGRILHAWVLKLGFQMDLHISTSLVHMYSRMGFIGDASKKFDEMPLRDLAAWNAMVSGFCLNGCAREAMNILEEMLKRGAGIDPVTMTSVLPVFAPLGNMQMVLLMHALAVKNGFHGDVFVCNALVDAYAKFCRIEDARLLFDTMPERDLVSWNSMISAYEQIGRPMSAVELYYKAKECDITPDALTLVSLASAASQIVDSRSGKSVHTFLLRRGLDSALVFVCNAVIDMYCKLGNMDYAWKIFEGMPARDVIAWNTLITGYAQNGLATESIAIFRTLQEQEVITPNQGTLVAILPAYAHVGSVHHGMKIHSLSIRMGFQSDIFVSTCLIDMYAKCGRLKDALLLFWEEPRRSSIPGMPSSRDTESMDLELTLLISSGKWRIWESNLIK